MESIKRPKHFINLILSVFHDQIPALSASLLRILIYATVFYMFSKISNVGYSKLDSEFWSPTGLARLMDFLRPPFPHFEILEKVWYTALILSILGLFSKASKTLSFLGFITVGAYDQHFGMVIFSGALLTFILFYMIFFEDRAFSLDRLLFRRGNAFQVVAVWPVLSFQVIQIFLYVMSGLQKLRYSGLEWLSGEDFRYFFVSQMSDPFLSYFLIFAATFSLLIELTSPLIFWSKLRHFYLVAFLAFHILGYIYLHIQDEFWILGLLTFYFSKPSAGLNSFSIMNRRLT